MSTTRIALVHGGYFRESTDTFERIRVAVLEPLKWVGAVESGLLQIHEVALVPRFVSSEV